MSCFEEYFFHHYKLPPREKLSHYASHFIRMPFLWNGKSCWKNMGGLAGPCYLFYHPNGGYYFSCDLMQPLDTDWSGILGWIEDQVDKWGPVHAPWNCRQKSVWRLEPESVQLNRELFSKHVELECCRMNLKKATEEVERLKSQFDLATSMLQKEWEPDDASPMSMTPPPPKTPPVMAPAPLLMPTCKHAAKPAEAHGAEASSSNLAPVSWLAFIMFSDGTSQKC